MEGAEGGKYPMGPVLVNLEWTWSEIVVWVWALGVGGGVAARLSDGLCGGQGGAT